MEYRHWREGFRPCGAVPKRRRFTWIANKKGPSLMKNALKNTDFAAVPAVHALHLYIFNIYG
jgi:hypothetical protein